MKINTFNALIILTLLSACSSPPEKYTLEQSQHITATQQQENDSRTLRDVHNALNDSNEVNGGSIVVETNNGTVQLSGVVRTVREKQRAESIAQSVQGVRQVFNSITVKN